MCNAFAITKVSAEIIIETSELILLNLSFTLKLKSLFRLNMLYLLT